MNPQFKKGVLELCVLATVRDKDRYGYELVENISQHIEISEGTIYPLLRRLTKDGYFETYLKESAEGPPRKYYSLSDRGKEVTKDLTSQWHDFVGSVNEILKKQN